LFSKVAHPPHIPEQIIFFPLMKKMLMTRHGIDKTQMKKVQNRYMANTKSLEWNGPKSIETSRINHMALVAMTQTFKFKG
jgi:hypothetical protein